MKVVCHSLSRSLPRTLTVLVPCAVCLKRSTQEMHVLLSDWQAVLFAKWEVVSEYSLQRSPVWPLISERQRHLQDEKPQEPCHTLPFFLHQGENMRCYTASDDQMLHLSRNERSLSYCKHFSSLQSNTEESGGGRDQGLSMHWLVLRPLNSKQVRKLSTTSLKICLEAIVAMH